MGNRWTRQAKPRRWEGIQQAGQDLGGLGLTNPIAAIRLAVALGHVGVLVTWKRGWRLKHGVTREHAEALARAILLSSD